MNIYPTLVSETTVEYQSNEDILADFIDECCIIDKRYRVSSEDIYDAFLTWYVRNFSKKMFPSHFRFATWMSKKFDRIKDGIPYYLGLSIAEQVD
jgi:putative DNA primase/helicase